MPGLRTSQGLRTDEGEKKREYLQAFGVPHLLLYVFLWIACLVVKLGFLSRN